MVTTKGIHFLHFHTKLLGYCSPETTLSNTYILGVGLLYIKTNRRQEEKSKVVKLTPQVLQIAPLYSSFRIRDQ